MARFAVTLSLKNIYKKKYIVRSIDSRNLVLDMEYSEEAAKSLTWSRGKKKEIASLSRSKYKSLSHLECLDGHGHHQLAPRNTGITEEPLSSKYQKKREKN